MTERRKKKMSKVEAARHLEFFALLPEGHKPKDIKEEYGGYSYEYVSGHMPENHKELVAVIDAANEHIWHVGGTLRDITSGQRYAYLDYVSRKIPDHLSYVMPKVMATIMNSTLTPAGEIHGDLTLENTIIEDGTGNAIFIDPGMVRGDLRCVEIDRAKLLQSTCTRWEIIRKFSKKIPFMVMIDGEQGNAELAFLITHWIRLAAHKELHGEDVVDLAHATIHNLWEMLP